MKKAVLCFVSIILIFYGNAVFAEEAYYINQNGLEFTEFQYNALVNVLNENIVQKMTYAEYQNFEVQNINEDSFNYQILEEDNSNSNARGNSHETACKKLVLSASCTSVKCHSTLSTVWKCIPSVRSYDVIGVRLASTTFYNDTFTFTYSAGGSVITTYAGRKGASNGVGYAYKMPSNGDVDYVTIGFNVYPRGRVYGTYQHAVKNISLNTALDFTFNSSGYGGVFAWPSSYGQIYDQTSGVYLALPV